MTEEEILQILKDKLLDVNTKLNEDSFSPLSMIKEHPQKAPFYLKNKSDNLYDGLIHDKIDKRANAIKSSAAMIFNTLGSTDFFIDGKKYNQIKYEEELKAIKTNDREHNAHLDARYVSEEGKEIVFVESKMLEWLSAPKNLARAYLDKNNYFSETGDATEIFIDFFKSLLQTPKKEDDEGRLVGKFRKYDAIQMTIHILGIYNFYHESGKQYNKIRLINIVWDDNRFAQYKREVKEAQEFIKLARNVLLPLFDGKFEIEYIPYSELYEKITFTDKNRKEYLRRYMLK